MSRPLVSVIMPAYNAQAWIVPAIESVLNQSLREVELIVVDDGSEDGTVEVAERFRKRGVVVLRQARNVGKPLAVAAAFNLSRGVYTTIHDADDVSFPDRLEKQVAALESDPDLALCGTAYIWIDLRGRPYHRIVLPVTYEAILAGLPNASQFHGPTVVMRTEVLRAMGGIYRPYFRVKGEDSDLCYRIAERYKCRNLADVLYATRVVPRSLSRGRVDVESLNIYRYIAHLAAERAAMGADSLQRNDEQASDRFWEAVKKPYIQDASRLHREAAAYHCGWCLHGPAVVHGFRAILTRPGLLLNYKNFCVLSVLVVRQMVRAGVSRLRGEFADFSDVVTRSSSSKLLQRRHGIR